MSERGNFYLGVIGGAMAMLLGLLLATLLGPR